MTRRKSPKERERERKGSGTVWERADGRFGAAITVSVTDALSGRVNRKRKTTTKKTAEEAEAWLDDVLRGVITFENAPFSRQTLADHLEVWLRDSVAPRVAPNTLQKRVWAASNHIVPALGHLALPSVSPRDVQGLYAALSREGYSLASRREIHSTLRQAMSQAVRWGMIERNPASPELVDTPKQSSRAGEDEEVRALSDEQARALFTYTERIGARWRHYYVVAVRTGLRPGEALGLRWKDIDLDLDPASLRVRRTLDTHYEARFGPPKSPASRRTLALHHEAAAALRAQRDMLEEEKLHTRPGDLVFPSMKGTPMSANNLRRRYFQRHLKEAGLPKRTLHEMRHTYASIALHDWRLPPKIVQKLMGHENLKMTMDLYGHLMPGAEAEVMRQLNDLHRAPKTVENSLREAR